MKRFGDRRDGVRVKVKGFEKFFYYLKPRRSESEVHILREIDVTELVEYYKKKKKENANLTYFHLFSTAFAKTIYNNLRLNRFVMNGNFYDRNEVTLSFVAKTEFKDDAPELLTVIKVAQDDKLETISKKIIGDVKKIRNTDNNKDNILDTFVGVFNSLPKFVIRFVMFVARFLDNHDMLPKALTSGSIFHSTVLLSNLGSIKCGGIYHNLTNFGTNSIVVTIGEIKEGVKVIDGEMKKRWLCQFGITLDERIADGVYFAKCVNMLEYILDKPEMLEDRVDAKIIISKSKENN